MVELLKQGQYAPLPVAEQVCSIYAGVNGHFDEVEVTEVAKFENSFLEFLRDQKPEILDAISNDGAIRDEDELIGAINEFKSLSASYASDAEVAAEEVAAEEVAAEEVAAEEASPAEEAGQEETAAEEATEESTEE